MESTVGRHLVADADLDDVAGAELLGREVGRELTVSLEYSTGAESTALQWLPPEQTAGKQPQ